MSEEKLEKLLNELGRRIAGHARPGLAEDIKNQIPHKLIPHRGGLDTISIIIDLRVSRVAAAAVIIVAMVLLSSFLGARNSPGGSVYKDGKLLLKYCLGNTGASQLSAGRSVYEHLVRQGRDVVYYGDSFACEDGNTVLMHWKLGDGEYGVMFTDLHTRTVSAEELINLQAQMLQKRAE
jgi:hypothetical protein